MNENERQRTRPGDLTWGYPHELIIIFDALPESSYLSICRIVTSRLTVPLQRRLSTSSPFNVPIYLSSADDIISLM